MSTSSTSRNNTNTNTNNNNNENERSERSSCGGTVTAAGRNAINTIMIMKWNPPRWRCAQYLPQSPLLRQRRKSIPSRPHVHAITHNRHRDERFRLLPPQDYYCALLRPSRSPAVRNREKTKQRNATQQSARQATRALQATDGIINIYIYIYTQ